MVVMLPEMFVVVLPKMVLPKIFVVVLPKMFVVVVVVPKMFVVVLPKIFVVVLPKIFGVSMCVRRDILVGGADHPRRRYYLGSEFFFFPRLALWDMGAGSLHHSWLHWHLVEFSLTANTYFISF